MIAKNGQGDDSGVPLVAGMVVPTADVTVIGGVVLVGTGVGHVGQEEDAPGVGVRVSVNVTSGFPRRS